MDQQTIRFFYIKSTQFRVMHVDGALGGLTPRGGIHLAIYSERPAIPQVATHELSPEGQLGRIPTETEGKEGIVREIDADLLLSRQAAIELRDFLTENINLLDSLTGPVAASK